LGQVNLIELRHRLQLDDNRTLDYQVHGLTACTLPIRRRAEASASADTRTLKHALYDETQKRPNVSTAVITRSA
jgi:hypothetical protein